MQRWKVRTPIFLGLAMQFGSKLVLGRDLTNPAGGGRFRRPDEVAAAVDQPLVTADPRCGFRRFSGASPANTAHGSVESSNRRCVPRRDRAGAPSLFATGAGGGSSRTRRS